MYLHLELLPDTALAIVVADYRSEAQVLDGIERLEALGIGVHNPHDWRVDRNLDVIQQVAAVRDPRGLLNPGKLTRRSPRPRLARSN